MRSIRDIYFLDDDYDDDLMRTEKLENITLIQIGGLLY